MDDRLRTTILINASAIIERVDEQLLPALYRFVGASFGASPATLGNLTLARALAQALASPAAGILGHKYNRILILSFGAFIWGAMTLGFGFTSSVAAALPLWACNGLGLSLLIPCSQSLTADYNPETARGRAFGLLHLVGAVGALIGALFATNIGGIAVFGIEGWRFAFMTVAIVSWGIGLATYIWGVDPRYNKNYECNRQMIRKRNEMDGFRSGIKQMWQLASVPSFLIIVLQGIVGTTPWSALVFLTLYFQLLGMSDFAASLLMAIFLGCNAAGGFIGGVIGDWAASKWPSHGRIVVCQFSVGIGVPLSFILFKMLPLTYTVLTAFSYALVLGVTGLLITWAATACNNPIFSEIVPPESRNLVYAFDRSFEGAIAAAGAPLVGYLAQKLFHFEGTAALSDDEEENQRRAKALANALLIMTTIPWTLCCLFFSALHWSYPRDKARALVRMESSKHLSVENVGYDRADGSLKELQGLVDRANYANSSSLDHLKDIPKCADFVSQSSGTNDDMTREIRRETNLGTSERNDGSKAQGDDEKEPNHLAVELELSSLLNQNTDTKST